MEINQKDKITILLHLLNERYNASHKIRERSFRLTIWVLGLAVAFVWILVSGTALSLFQRLLLTILVFVLGSATIWFLYSLERGFDKNREVMIDLEEALGCYKDGLYLDSKSLFPVDYKETNKKLQFSHFKTIYFLIIPIAILITILIWVTPPKAVKGSKIDKTENRSQTQVEKFEIRI